jgi:hypothetical protein
LRGRYHQFGCRVHESVIGGGHLQQMKKRQIAGSETPTAVAAWKIVGINPALILVAPRCELRYGFASRHPLRRRSPGVVDTPLHEGVPKESLTTRQPLKTITEVKDIVDAVLYLVRTGQVTGEVLRRA